ncbi:hypothetical protein KCP77_16440 [Salmonella enterica subsp. enterica]|nr:hypothetical protein KCP77_16440 [Salmonella enterica subsp. enterica]
MFYTRLSLSRLLPTLKQPWTLPQILLSVLSVPHMHSVTMTKRGSIKERKVRQVRALFTGKEALLIGGGRRTFRIA